MNPQTFNLRVDSITEKHVHCTLFMNGAMLGTLTFHISEYQIFGATLLLGVEKMHGRLINKSDDSVFVEWTKRRK